MCGLGANLCPCGTLCLAGPCFPEPYYGLYLMPPVVTFTDRQHCRVQSTCPVQLVPIANACMCRPTRIPFANPALLSKLHKLQMDVLPDDLKLCSL